MTNEVVMYRANDKTVQLTILRESTGDAYNIAGCTIVMYIKKNISDLDADAVITKTGTITGAASGIVEFYLIPSDTEDLTEIKDNTPYPVDFELTTASGLKYTVLRTSFVILAK